MGFINDAAREIHLKFVYYGPGLSGKTTFMQFIYNHLGPDRRGQMLSVQTETDRTLFFDFLPVYGNSYQGYKVRYHLYSVPGQVFYSETRRLLLKGVDGIIFVCDSQRNMMFANIESLKELTQNLVDLCLSLDKIPIVFCFNKRDLPVGQIMDETEMNAVVNPDGRIPCYQTVAIAGRNAFDSLSKLSDMAMVAVKKKVDGVRIEAGSELAPATYVSPSEPALMSLDFTTHYAFTGIWNPIRFRLTGTGKTDQCPVYVQFGVETGTGLEMRSMQAEHLFEIVPDGGHAGAVLWVKPLSDGPKALKYSIRQREIKSSSMYIEKAFLLKAQTLRTQIPTDYGQRVLRSLMFIDIVKSTNLWADKHRAIMMMENLKLVISSIAGQYAKINKAVGDAYVLYAESPTYAIFIAKAIKRYLEQLSQQHEEHDLSVRFGLDVGEVALHELNLQTDKELFGVNVSFAARLCGKADPGEIAVSELVYHMVAVEMKGHIDFIRSMAHFDGFGEKDYYCVV